MSEDNKNLIEQFVHNSWVKGRYNIVRKMVTRDFLFHASSSLDSCGIDCFIREVEELREALGDAAIDIEDIFTDGDRAISVMTVCGTFMKPVMGFEPNQKAVGLTFVITWQLQRGKVRHMNVMADMASLQRQVAAA